MEKNWLAPITLAFIILFIFPRMLSAPAVTGAVTVLDFIYSVNVTTTSSSARIDWMTLENATGLVEYGLSPSYGANESSAANTTNHSIIITGLSPATLYHYRIWSCTNSMNCFKTSDANFTTQPVSATPTPGGGGAGGGGYGPAFGVLEANATPIPYPITTPVPTPYPSQNYSISKTIEGEAYSITVNRRLVVREELLSPTGYLSTVTLFVRNNGATRLSSFEVREKIPAIIGEPTDFQYSIPPTFIRTVEVVWRIGYLDPGDVIAFSYVTTKMIPSSYMAAYQEPVINIISSVLPSPTPSPTALPTLAEKKLELQEMLAAYALPAAGIALVVVALIAVAACAKRRALPAPAPSARELRAKKIEKILEKVRAYRKQRTASKRF